MPLYVCTYKSTDGPDGISLECFFTPSLHEAKERDDDMLRHSEADEVAKLFEHALIHLAGAAVVTRDGELGKPEDKDESGGREEVGGGVDR